MKHVAHNIKQLRQKRSWNQGELADRLGISIPALSKIETGMTDINLSRLFQLTEIFDVSVMEILFEGEWSNSNVDKKELIECQDLLKIKEKEVFDLQKIVIELYGELRAK